MEGEREESKEEHAWNRNETKMNWWKNIVLNVFETNAIILTGITDSREGTILKHFIDNILQTNLNYDMNF